MLDRMAIERIPVNPVTNREEWLAVRKEADDVTASTIGALHGVHPFETILGLYAAKSGIEFPDSESTVLKRGTVLEPICAAEIGKLRPDWRLVKANAYYRDPVARIGATPDYLIEGDPRGPGVLQCKTTANVIFRRDWLANGEATEPTAPLWIGLQTLTECMLTDAAFGAIGVLVIGDFVFDAYLIEVPRHPRAEQRIRAAVKQFWDALAAGQLPVIDYERDGNIIRLMCPHEVEGKVIDLRTDNRAAALCDLRKEQQAIIKAAEKIKDQAENELREKIGDAEIALFPDGWSATLRTTNVPEQLRAAYSFRTLRTKREEV
jgi:predicted phage-related endonuclease